MIAHRLTTISSADNLLYFKSRSELVSATKGSSEYDEIFEKLKCIQYAYGDDDGQDGQNDENSDDSDQNDDAFAGEENQGEGQIIEEEEENGTENSEEAKIDAVSRNDSLT